MGFYLRALAIMTMLSFLEMRFINNKEEKKVLLSISRGLFPCVFLFFLAGMRSLRVGKDTYNYSKFFLTITFENVHMLDINHNWIYNLWAYVIRMITDNVIIFNMCCAFVIYYALYRFIKQYSCDERVSMILFITLGVFFNSLNQTRQALATAIIIIGFKYAVEKDLIKALLSCVIATFIHNVAVVMIPIYLLFCLLPRIGAKVVMVFSCAAIAVAVLYNRIIVLFVMVFPRYESYLRYSRLFVQRRSIYRYGDFLLALVLQIILVYGLYKASKNKNEEREANDFGNILACMNAIYLCVTYLILNGDVFNRIKSLVIYWLLLTIPYIIHRFFKDNTFIKIAVCLLSIAYMWRLGVHDGDGVVPYSFFFNMENVI